MRLNTPGVKPKGPHTRGAGGKEATSCQIAPEFHLTESSIIASVDCSDGGTIRQLPPETCPLQTGNALAYWVPTARCRWPPPTPATPTGVSRAACRSSDNQSWVGAGRGGATAVMTQWQTFARNQVRLHRRGVAGPKLACFDLAAVRDHPGA